MFDLDAFAEADARLAALQDAPAPRRARDREIRVEVPARGRDVAANGRDAGMMGDAIARCPHMAGRPA